MRRTLALAAAGLGLIASSHAALPSDIIGTWSTKSGKTLTGPGFYDAINDKLIEPSHTGISYSFTADGYYEEAYYRAIANPVRPNCPGGIMQWQHGTWEQLSNGSLALTPIATDGRQLLSKPCDNENAIYTRYNQSETFKQYQVLTDPYHNVKRLNLWEFDGTPMQPFYIAFEPPQMLPTTTLHAATTETAKAGKKGKRGLEDAGPASYMEVPLNWKSKFEQGKSGDMLVQNINPDRLWWVGLAFTGIGGLLYFGPRRLGLRI
ncbi:unnamed protein product [Cercospora beticola]|nr:unnamed protein product [Cercospora beticola]